MLRMCLKLAKPREELTQEKFNEIETKLNFKFGKQLTFYLKTIGKVKIFGREINGYWQGNVEDCSIVKRTLKERGFYSEMLRDYVVIENDGFGNLYLIDKDDNIFFFNHENRMITETGKTFNDFCKLE